MYTVTVSHRKVCPFYFGNNFAKCRHTRAHTHTHTHRFTSLLDFFQEGETNLDLLEQEIMNSSGIS